MSWFHYDGANPDACTGLHPRAASLSEATVTIHHSFFDHVEGTSPYVDHAGSLVHLFNDFFGDNPSFAVGAGCSAEILLEGST